jgi:hypothetical protein
MIPNSIFKKNGVFGSFKTLVKAWSDLLFPPLCAHCEELCDTQFFCLSCWDLCAPPHPEHRCRHCFIEAEDMLCLQCQKEPLLFAPYASVFEAGTAAQRLCLEGKESPEALGAFALYQWTRLGWPLPDLIIPMPDAQRLVASFALWLDVPYARLLHIYHGLCECRADKIEEDQVLLLFDLNSSLSQLQKAIDALSEAFPKRIYVLSLIHYDHSFHS